MVNRRKRKCIVEQMMYKKVCLLVLQKQLQIRLIKTKVAVLKKDLAKKAKTRILYFHRRRKRKRVKIQK
jgi:hypothetical protein